MDIIGMPYSGYPLSEEPLGFYSVLAMSEPAEKAYSQMTESEKEQVLNRCRDAKNRSQLQEIVDSLVPDGNINNLLEGPGIG